MCRCVLGLLVAAVVLAACAADLAADFKPAEGSPPRYAAAGGPEHPFLLWNKQDLAVMRKRIETQDWAKAALQRWLTHKDAKVRDLGRLVQYAALGDKQAGEAQKKELMRVVRSPVPRGAAQWITVLRYDLLYDDLTPDERAAFEKLARTYVENHVFKRAIFDGAVFNDSRRYSRYDARKYTRSNWLPNIIWPWKVSANLMALVLRDEDLIRKTWAAYGSWKWYFDEYLCDSGFYAEEFSKMGSTPGAMLVYCIGAERLGLGELGFGYRGKGGATMRGHVESLIHLGYPRVDLCSDRPQYPIVTMGDLRQTGSSQAYNLASPAFQHSLVMGYMPDGTGGTIRWRAHGAWGGTVRGNNAQWDGYSGFTPKMQAPLWFELGHARWPESGFAYFLAQMREPGQKQYVPSLLFGIGPIDAAKVQPPPAPSALWPDRGIVMLRADESPAYWESPAPAAAMRLATNYAHNVNDCFALLGFYAFNRPIYINRQITPGYAQGWSRSIQSHCGVTVDSQEPRFTDATATRKAFSEAVKFAAARSTDVYPGVDLTRALMLTREYLLDVTRLAGADGKQRRFTWFLHALGQVEAGDAARWQEARLPEGVGSNSPDGKLDSVLGLDTGGKGWSVTAIQTCALDDPSKAKLPRQWYDRRVGVRMSMLGHEGLAAYTARTPRILREVTEGKDKRTEELTSEVGGVTIVANRSGTDATFAALHEPFEQGAPRRDLPARRDGGGPRGNVPRTEFRGIQQTRSHLAVAIVGPPGSVINDRAMLCLGDGQGQGQERSATVTLSGGGESFTFADYVWLRVAKDRVTVSGGLKAMKLRVQGSPSLILNGRPGEANVSGDYLVYKAPQGALEGE